MATAHVFTYGREQAVKLPKEFEFTDVCEVEIRKQGNSIILTPVRKSWASFALVQQADEDFLSEREDVLEAERVRF